MNWQPGALTGMGKGVVARKVLNDLFSILSERLRAASYDRKIFMSDAEWPRLEVGKQDWERIFGKGYNNKLYLWFAVPGIWRATEHQFWPEIILWNKQHGNAWAVVQSKITAWIKQLRKLGFSHFVEGRGIDQEKFDIMKSGLPERARRIVAYSERAAIGEQQIEKLSQADLVNVLYDTIVKQCAIIDGLT